MSDRLGLGEVPVRRRDQSGGWYFTRPAGQVSERDGCLVVGPRLARACSIQENAEEYFSIPKVLRR